MARIDYYSTLGIRPDASDEEIKKAYRKLVFEYHPDRHPDSKVAEEKIRDINAAYEVLGDPETRRTYERLRFGDEVREEAPDPAVVLEEMEQKLYEEGRKEIFAVLMKDVQRIKAELALIRKRTVEAQGYDTFKDSVVIDRAAEAMHEFVTPEMEGRKKRLLDVALQMMVSQRVIRKQDDEQFREVQTRFQNTYRRGRISGYRNALELFYARK
jgi:molecular chaperone DnaJ